MRRTGVFPCRYDKGKGWYECPVARATHWRAVVRDRTVGYYPNKREAEKMVEFASKRVKGPARGYRLGTPMGKAPWL